MQSHIGCICFTFLHCVLKSKIIFQQQTTSLSAILQLEGHQPHAQGRPLVKLNLQFLTPPLLMEDWQNMIPEQNEKRGVNVSNCGGEKCQIWGGKGTLMGGKCVKIMGGKCAKGKWIMTVESYSFGHKPFKRSFVNGWVHQKDPTNMQSLKWIFWWNLFFGNSIFENILALNLRKGVGFVLWYHLFVVMLNVC